MSEDEALIRQAMELLRRAEALRAVRGEGQSAPTIEELWELYAKAMSPRIARWSTVECLMRPVRKRFGARAASSLRRSDMDEYITHRLGQVNERGRAPAPQTINHEMTRLAALLNWAVDERLITGNPIRRKPRCPVPKRTRPEWGEAQLDRLVELAEEDWFKSMIVVRWETGMRPGEARALRWEWVHLKQHCIRLPAEATKTRTARTVSLTPPAVAALESLPRLGAHVFAQHNGNPWCAVAVWKRWRATVERSGFEDAHGKHITFHDLRAIWCNLARRRGMDLVERMAQVGHDSLEVHGRYEDCTESDLHREMQKFHAGAERERRGPRASHRRRTGHRRSA